MHVNLTPTANQSNAWKRTSTPAAGGPTAGTVIKASAGRLRLVRVTNSGAAAIYLQVHDLAVAPTTTVSVAADRAQVPIGATAVIDYGPEGLACANGIALAASSTAGVFTAIAGTDAHFMAEWM